MAPPTARWVEAVLAQSDLVATVERGFQISNHPIRFAVVEKLYTQAIGRRCSPAKSRLLVHNSDRDLLARADESRIRSEKDEIWACPLPRSPFSPYCHADANPFLPLPCVRSLPYPTSLDLLPHVYKLCHLVI